MKIGDIIYCITLDNGLVVTNPDQWKGLDYFYEAEEENKK